MAHGDMKNMTVGKPLRLLLLFTFPLLLGNLTQQLYTFVDVAVIGNNVGLFALSAIGSADRLIWLMQNLLIGMTAGFAVQAALVMGEGDHETVKKVITRSIVLTLILSVSVTVLAHLLAAPLFTLIRTPLDARPIALRYVRVIFTGLPVTAMYQLLSAILRSLGDSKTPFRAMLITSTLNILLDLLFIPVLGMGAEGAAVATVLAQAVGAVWCFTVLKKTGFLILTREKLCPEKGLDRRLLSLGSPVSLMNIVIGLGGFAVQYAVNYYGDAVAAGVTATEKIYSVIELVATSLGFAMAAYVGQNYGANERKRVRDGIRTCTLLSFGTGAFFTLMLFLIGDPILNYLIKGEEEMRAVSFELASHHMRVIACALPFLFLIILFRSALQGVGNTIVPMIAGWVELVFRCIWALCVCPNAGVWSILYINVFAWLASLTIDGVGCLRLTAKLRKEETASAPIPESAG